MTAARDLRVLHAAGDAVGEAPLWIAATRSLWWVDIGGRRVHRFDVQTGGVTTRPCPLPPAALFADDADRLIVAAGTGWFRLMDDGALDPLAVAPAPEGGWRMNDGCVDTAGRIWTGSLDEPRGSGAGGAVFRLDARGACQVLDGFGVQNGSAVSPDGRRLYLSDTHPDRRAIWVWTLDAATGALSDRRLFHRCTRGRPDGGTTDADGCYWFAAIDAGEIVRLDPEGREMASFALPVSRPTKVAFWGDGLDRMAVTTMRGALTPAQLAAQPLAGALFDFDPGARGWELPRARPQ